MLTSAAVLTLSAAANAFLNFASRITTDQFQREWSTIDGSGYCRHRPAQSRSPPLLTLTVVPPHRCCARGTGSEVAAGCCDRECGAPRSTGPDCKRRVILRYLARRPIAFARSGRRWLHPSRRPARVSRLWSALRLQVAFGHVGENADLFGRRRRRLGGKKPIAILRS